MPKWWDWEMLQLLLHPYEAVPGLCGLPFALFWGAKRAYP